MAKKQSYPELNHFNAVACLFVVLIHVLSVAISSLDPSSGQAAVVFLPWKLAAYVVPGFLFSGAVKMALGFASNDRPLTLQGYLKYVLRRVQKIYLPYVAWVGVYYLYFLRLGWVEAGIDVFLEYVFLGSLSSPFYYVVTVMQFYLLMPLWRWMVRRIPFVVGILVAGMVTFGMLYADGILAQMGLSFAWRDRVFPSYLLFWVLGLYVGRHYDAVRNLLTEHIRSVMAMLMPILLYAVGMLVQYARGVWMFDGNVIKMFSDCMTILVVLTACIWFCDHERESAVLRFLAKPLGFIYAASFTVYLSHCLFLQIIIGKISEYGITDMGVQILLRALMCYTAPFLLWYGWHLLQKGVRGIWQTHLRKE